MSENKMTCNSIEAEYQDICNKNAWLVVFQKLGRECQSYQYTIIEAKKPENKHLNRYRDVNPYDHSRIVLKRCNQDYINANLVKMDRANRKYILTQGPLGITVEHFWLMVWEQKSKAIIMLNKLVEKREAKCHMYWPVAVGEEEKLDLPEVKLNVQLLSEDDHEYYWTRRFKIFDLESGDSREVIQFHYITWPDFGVPSSPVAFLNFWHEVRSSRALEPDAGPAIVHCSAGIGRSGTFCLVDSCLVIIEHESVDSVNIQQILLDMRKDRMGLIQTPDQLKFSYQAIIEGIKRIVMDPQELWKQREIEAERVEKQDAMKPESVDSDEEMSDDEPPPPPPPRVGSLENRPPARPLPALPRHSTGNLCEMDEMSSSDEVSSTQDSKPAKRDESEDDEAMPDTTTAAASGDALRRRKKEELAERVNAMKRKARETERWNLLKRSLYKPLTITFGFLIAGIVIYAYVKN